MTTLADFFDRVDALATPASAERLIDDEAIAQAGAAMLPMFERLAERAGVTLDEVRGEIAPRIEGPCDVMAVRVERGDDVVETMRLLAIAAGLQFFLAGVVWQQDREMPTL